MPRKKKLNRDTELLKIQIFADYCQTKFTSRTSLWVSAFVGLLLVLFATAFQLGTVYQGLQGLQGLILWLAFYSSIGTSGIFLYRGIKKVVKDYHNDLDKIQVFLNSVEKNEPLPTLKEMIKIRKRKK